MLVQGAFDKALPLHTCWTLTEIWTTTFPPSSPPSLQVFLSSPLSLPLSLSNSLFISSFSLLSFFCSLWILWPHSEKFSAKEQDKCIVWSTHVDENMNDKIRIGRELQGGGVRIRLACHSHAVESSALSRGDFALALSFPTVSAKREERSRTLLPNSAFPR